MPKQTTQKTPQGSGAAFETARIADLKTDPRNARRHDKRNLEAIADSLERFGQQKPIVVLADNTVIAGNGTLEAAKHLGWTEIAIMRSRLEGPEATAYGIADNRTAELADWDDKALGTLLDELRLHDPSLVAAGGFEIADIDSLLKRLQEDDEVPIEAPEEPITRPGDLYFLGGHRLLCGDSTDAASVARLLDGAKPELMVTDPPYGVEYDPTWRAEAGVNRNRGKLGLVQNDEKADWREAWKLFDGAAAYVYHAGVKSRQVQESLEASGFAIRAQIVWAKDKPALSRGDYHWQHEPCFYAVREGMPGRRNDDRSQSTLWSIKAREDKGHGHGTQKPVECMARPIRNHQLGDVYDPFLGSGTTLIACERLGKRCFGMELSPAYCDIIVSRWEKETGLKAERHRSPSNNPIDDA